MTFKGIETKTKFAKSLTTDSADTISDLLTITPLSIPGYRIIQKWNRIENINICNMIKSLAAIEYPKFGISASESEEQLALLNLQWTSERFHLNFYLDIQGQDRTFLTTYSLLSVVPYPYANIPVEPINLGDGDMISIGIEDAGYGLLQAQDKVIISGELIQNLWLEKSSDSAIKIANLITTNPSLIVNSNPLRTGIDMVNITDKTIYLDTQNTVSDTSYLRKLLPGDELSEAGNSPYTGEYYAVVEEGTANLEIREYT
ncbi:hypothetical protein [Anabaena lutea]|uniref:Uncharacterized protein n=1 Tax=Anabaena lutea FACHB-196 TaxID=2692881 RepID=A0ABR8FLI4_9NOST|nr:hypothetical protein [Anabaena lutea]MBD2571062.1 hypothetical protein [Anabaena lutea FACHB-196]